MGALDASGRPSEQWPRLYEAIEKLRDVSGEATLAVLEMAVAKRLDTTFGRDIARTVRTSSAETTPPDSA